MYYWSSLWTNTVRKWMSLHVLNGNFAIKSIPWNCCRRTNNKSVGPRQKEQRGGIPGDWCRLPSPLKRFSQLTRSHSTLFNLHGSEYSIYDKHPAISQIMVPDWIKRQDMFWIPRRSDGLGSILTHIWWAMQADSLVECCRSRQSSRKVIKILFHPHSLYSIFVTRWTLTFLQELQGKIGQEMQYYNQFPLVS